MTPSTCKLPLQKPLLTQGQVLKCSTYSNRHVRSIKICSTRWYRRRRSNWRRKQIDSSRRPWLAKISPCAAHDPSQRRGSRCRSRYQKIFATSINSYQVSHTRAQRYGSHSQTSIRYQTRRLPRQSLLRTKKLKYCLRKNPPLHLRQTSFEQGARTAANHGRVPQFWPAVRRPSAFSCHLRRCSRAGKGAASSKPPPRVRSTPI